MTEVKFQRSRMRLLGEARRGEAGSGQLPTRRGDVRKARLSPPPSAGPLLPSSFLSPAVSSSQQGLSLRPLRSVVLPLKTQAWSYANRDF